MVACMIVHKTEGEKVATDTDTNPQVTVFATIASAWPLLSPVDRTNFWEFAAAEAQNYKVPVGPRRHDGVFDGLSSAIVSLGNRATSKKSAIVGLPLATKRLSANELQRGLLRHRDRLLNEPDAQRFLLASFCRWVQLSRRDALVASLEALQCPHDEVGNLKGKIPGHDEESARAALLPLAQVVDARDLALVCYALAINAPAWRPLLACTTPLMDVIARQRESDDRPVARGDVSAAMPQLKAEEPSINPPVAANEVGDALLSQTAVNLPFGPEDLRTLEHDFRDLQQMLENAVVAMDQAQLPDLVPVLRHWASVNSQFEKACLNTSEATKSLDKLRSFVRQKQEMSLLRPLLERLTAVGHKSDPTYTAHLPVVADAKHARLLLDEEQFEQLQKILPALRSVEVLVRCGGELQEAEAALHDEVVRNAYGSLLAIGLQRGRIVFENSQVLSPSNEQETSSSAGVVVEPLGEASALSIEAEQTVARADQPQGQPLPAPEIEHSEFPEISPQTSDDEISGLKGRAAQASEEDSLAFACVPDGAAVPEVASEQTALPATLESEEPAAAVNAPLPYKAEFSEFKRSAWVDPRGIVRAAPWVNPEFGIRMSDLALDSWDRGSQAKAYLCAKVSDQLSQLNVADLTAADRLLDHPLEIASLRDPLRASRLRMEMQTGVNASPTLALAVTLEAVAPTGPVTWSHEEAQHLCQRAGLRSSALVTVLCFTLTAWSSAEDPISLIRTLADTTPADPAQLTRKYLTAQAELQRVVAAQWNAAGGRITQNHTKKIWTSFIRNHVAPLRDALAPLKAQGSIPQLSPAKARSEIEALAKAFAAMMKDGDVRKGDLTAAQSGAYQIVAAIERVVDAKSLLKSLAGKKALGTKV